MDLWKNRMNRTERKAGERCREPSAGRNKIRDPPADALGLDYGVWHYTPMQLLTNGAVYLLIDGAVALLFYRSWVVFAALLPGVVIFLRERKKTLIRRRRQVLQTQFMTGIQMVHTALTAGYAAENAFREALLELERIYSEDSWIVPEFKRIVSGISVNISVEKLLLDLGQRSGVEDIESFAEVFYTAKRTGGDLLAIIRNTISGIRQKEETRLEIETVLAGRRMEQRMMSVIPLLILGYVSLTSPGFLDVMYHNTAGIIVMTLCLLIYALAVLWGARIMRIDV